MAIRSRLVPAFSGDKMRRRSSRDNIRISCRWARTDMLQICHCTVVSRSLCPFCQALLQLAKFLRVEMTMISAFSPLETQWAETQNGGLTHWFIAGNEVARHGMACWTARCAAGPAGSEDKNSNCPGGIAAVSNENILVQASLPMCAFFSFNTFAYLTTYQRHQTHPQTRPFVPPTLSLETYAQPPLQARSLRSCIT